MEFEENLINYIQSQQQQMPRLVWNNLNKDGSKFHHRIEYKRVENHLNNFLEKEDYNRFIVMPGLRGVGKTTILFQIYDYLVNKKGIDYSSILYIDTNDLKNFIGSNILDAVETFLKEIHQTTMVNLNKKIFLLIDESHIDTNWALTGKSIYDKTKNIFMIFTGSQALNLGENADVNRRIVKEIIFPLNFPEYLCLKHDIPFNKDINPKFTDLIFNGDKNSFDNIINLDSEIQNSFIKINNDPDIEFRKFLFSYGFPYSLNMNNEFEIAKKTLDNIYAIIHNDIPSLKIFNTSTNVVIYNIIIYLALQKPGATSNVKLAQSLNISPKTVNDILNVLEKTQLIFSLKPYGSGGKIIKKPWQYFFLTPSLKAAINCELGRYNINHKKCLATLAETLVISSLFKLKEISKRHIGLFYDSSKGGVDFLIKDLDRIIPIEVGVGKKTKSQLTKAINSYNSDYGILISNRTSKIKYENNVIYIPLRTFSYL